MWVCNYCERERSDNTLQCCCGTWRDFEARELYWKGSSIKKCFVTLESKFEFPCESIKEKAPIIWKDKINYKSKRFYEKKEIIRKYVEWLLEYQGIDNNRVIVNIYEKKDSTKQQGHYSKRGYYAYNTIDIGISYFNSIYTDLYIATHEIMHALLDSKDIKLNNRIENEMLTDVAVYYFGLGDFLERGSVVSWDERETHVLYDEVKHRKMTYGYLNEDNKVMAARIYTKKIDQLNNRKKILFDRLEEIEFNSRLIKRLFNKSLKNKKMDIEQQLKMREITRKKDELNRKQLDLNVLKKEIENYKTKKEFDDCNHIIKQKLKHFIELRIELENVLNKKRHKKRISHYQINEYACEME